VQAFPGVVERSPGRFETECGQDENLALALIGSAMGAIIFFSFTAVSIFLLVSESFLIVFTAPAALGSFAFLFRFARELWMRVARMGRFVVDAPSAQLFRNGSQSGRRIARIRVSTHMAASFSGGGGAASWWVLADVAGGPTYRIAKGPWSQVRALLGRMKAFGLPVEGHDEAVLLRTSYNSITKLSPTRFEFRAPETMAKIMGTVLLVVFSSVALLLVAGLVYQLVSGAIDPGTLLGFGVILLFFLLLVTVAGANLVHFTRRSGVFVLDLAAGTLERNGRLVARPGEIARFRAGNPTLWGFSKGRLLGPQALAIELRSGRRFHLLRSLPGDVRFAASVLESAGVRVDEG
jgi:hypothetical protein